MSIEIINGECLTELGKLVDREIKVDAVICDLPYGTTASKWDTPINLKTMWERLEYLTSPNTPVCLFGKEPFSSSLRVSNPDNFKYDWVWRKTRPGRYVQAKKMPLTIYEIVSVFYKKLPTYNPQFWDSKPYSKTHQNTTKPNFHGKEKRNGTVSKSSGKRYPLDIIEFANPNKGSLHPTQKPIPLMEYFVKTYTNPGDLVLDFTMGVGSTGVACKNLGRSFIGVELDPDYFSIAEERLNDRPARGY